MTSMTATSAAFEIAFALVEELNNTERGGVAPQQGNSHQRMGVVARLSVHRADMIGVLLNIYGDAGLTGPEHLPGDPQASVEIQARADELVRDGADDIAKDQGILLRLVQHQRTSISIHDFHRRLERQALQDFQIGDGKQRGADALGRLQLPPRQGQLFLAFIGHGFNLSPYDTRFCVTSRL